MNGGNYYWVSRFQLGCGMVLLVWALIGPIRNAACDRALCAAIENDIKSFGVECREVGVVDRITRGCKASAATLEELSNLYVGTLVLLIGFGVIGVVSSRTRRSYVSTSDK